MRILFCTNSLGAKGGIEKVTIVKANALADIKGNKVAVCFTDRGSYPWDVIHPISEKVQIKDLGVTFWDLCPLNFMNIFIKAPIKYLRLRKALKACILDFCPDIVISTGSYEKYALASIKLAHLLGKRCCKVREYHFCSNYRDYLPVKSWFSKVVSIFEYGVLGRMFDMNFLLTREDMERNFPNRKGYDYMYNPLTFTIPKSLPIAKRDKAVIMVGRLTDQKNVQAVIRIWASIIDDFSGWRLRIVGDGELRQELVELTSSLGVTDSVDFLGFRKDLPNLLSSCRLLVVTSKYEGFGLNIVEAMACGTVPVAYRTPYGPADIISDGVDGMLVDYLNEDMFAFVLKTLMASSKKLENMSEAAKRRAKDYCVDAIASQWMSKFEEILNV